MPLNHKTLARQLNKLGLCAESPPKSRVEWMSFLEKISSFYSQMDEDRYLLERSIEISSIEMRDRFNQIHNLVDQLKTNESILRDVIENKDRNEILNHLNEHIESKIKGVQCGILKKSQVTNQLQLVAGSNLSSRIKAIMQSVEIDDNNCPCSIAAFSKMPFSYQGEKEYKFHGLFNELGINSCYSYPVLDENHEVVAVFTLLSKEPANFLLKDKELVNSVSTAVKTAFGYIEMKDQLQQKQGIEFVQAKMATLGELAGNIAHEINNPLFIIQSYIDLNIDMVEAGEIDKKVFLKTLKQMDTNVSRIARIVKTLRHFTRDSSSDELQPVTVRSLMEDALELSAQRYSNVGFELNLDDRLAESKILCQPPELVQVIINLLNNSYYEVKDKKNSWIKVNLKNHLDSLIIEVIDSGLGISEEVREKIFNPFFTTKPVGVGNGFGLNISQKIIESHGGTIKYDADSSNTKFVIQIPFRNGYKTNAA
jgi:signal transduction histidine kinase